MGFDKKIYAAIDANINRVFEGLRVCEDICRFVLWNKEISAELKKIRHEFSDRISVFTPEVLLNARDTENDTIKFLDLKSELARDSVPELFKKNIHRAIEAMRSIEEFYKLTNPADNPFQKLRFDLYNLEKNAFFINARTEKTKRFANSLYAILDSSFVHDNDYVNTAQRFIKGGAAIIQLRMKTAKMRDMLNTAKNVSALCRKHGVIFIVNDYPEIAYLADADGVHLGQDDLDVCDVRKLLPQNMLIGVSTHSKAQAVAAIAACPDYIAVGPIFDTETKTGEKLSGIGKNILHEIDAGDTPVVAIGGLTPQRISEIKDTRLCFAVISYLYNNNEIEQNCQDILYVLSGS